MTFTSTLQRWYVHLFQILPFCLDVMHVAAGNLSKQNLHLEVVQRRKTNLKDGKRKIYQRSQI